ncbi:MAG: Zn finger-containing GTPase- Activating Protein for ARF [Vezdaea aestivalis]|nr:MAG: Zn finger-containing GTPase- Activating Protein for ARF [Vezdaea aestivalis]
MDAFKTGEIARMDKGGNALWKSFFESHAITQLTGLTWDDTTVSDRYSGDVGEEWKERLTAQIEGKEYVPSEKPKAIRPAASIRSGASKTGSAVGSTVGSRSGTPLGRGPNQKVQNEAYFAKMGEANATRPDGLPPSEGGKYDGFGSSPWPEKAYNDSDTTLPGFDELQKDPVAALTKSFGWFTTTVGKGAKTVNEGFIQPTAAKVLMSSSAFKIAEADITSQARATATTLGQGIQTNAKSTSDTFNRFVQNQGGNSRGVGAKKDIMDNDKRGFWDSFGTPEEVHLFPKPEKPSAIGTAAMRKGPSETNKKNDEWGEDW